MKLHSSQAAREFRRVASGKAVKTVLNAIKAQTHVERLRAVVRGEEGGMSRRDLIATDFTRAFAVVLQDTFSLDLTAFSRVGKQDFALPAQFLSSLRANRRAKAPRAKLRFPARWGIGRANSRKSCADRRAPHSFLTKRNIKSLPPRKPTRDERARVNASDELRSRRRPRQLPSIRDGSKIRL